MDDTSVIVTEPLCEFLADQMAFCKRKSKLKDAVSFVLYGQSDADPDVPAQRVAPRTYERVAHRAREILHERSLIKADEAKAESIGFYEAVIASDDAPIKAKMKARENLDNIHRVQTSSLITANFDGIDIEDLNLTLDQKKMLLGKIRDKASY